MKDDQDVTEYSDEDLMKIFLDERDSNQNHAKIAFGELYKRYAEKLFRLCCEVCQGKVETDIVFERTWQRVLKYPTYCIKNERSGFLSWLSSIARRVWCDLQKKVFLCDNLPTQELSLTAVFPEEHEERPPSIEEEKLNEAMAMLPERERDILLTYAEYDVTVNHPLPTEVLGLLKARYKTSSANIRQIKKRALQKVKDVIAKLQ